MDVGLQSFVTGQFHADTNYVVPHAPATAAVEVINQGWWGPAPAPAARQCPHANESNTWCHCVVIGNASGTKLSVPYDWTTADGPRGVLSAGNNGASIMLNATHAIQMQVSDLVVQYLNRHTAGIFCGPVIPTLTQIEIAPQGQAGTY